jgi:hypothetical protein
MGPLCFLHTIRSAVWMISFLALFLIFEVGLIGSRDIDIGGCDYIMYASRR